MVAIESFLTEHLKTHHAWADNEATMVANVLLPVLERLGPSGLEIRAECRIELDLGRRNFSLDTSDKIPEGRADFFLVERATGRVLVVVEAKPPHEDLTERDRKQLGSYMGAVRPLAPFGILTNGKEVEVHGWYDGTTKVIQADGTLDTSVAVSVGEAIRERSLRLLLRDSPEFRDQVLSQLSRGELDHRSRRSPQPRALVRELADRVRRGDRGVVFVVSPPQCGRTQLLVDLGAALPDKTPLVFGTVDSESGTQLNDLLSFLNPTSSSGEIPFVEYLRARLTSSTLCLLVDCHAASIELHRVLGAIAGSAEIATLAIVCAPYSVMRHLLFMRDFENRLPEAAVTLYEMAGFSDEELEAVFPTYEPRLGSQPVWRLLRWPGIHTVLRREQIPGLHIGEALGRWFRDRSDRVSSALHQLGRLLANEETRNLERVPDQLPDDLRRALLDEGLAVQVLERGGFDHRLACIEVGMFALLSYVFDASDRPRRDVLTRIVERAKPNSQAETVALIALLPHFLVNDQATGPVERIVRRMVTIAFASYALEGLDRTGMFRELEAELATVKEPANPFLEDESRPLQRVLLRVRERIGVMPNFREMEKMFGESFRQYGGRADELSRLKLTADELVDARMLERLKMVELLDALDLLAKGQTSWVSGLSDEAGILRVAKAIAAAIEPRRRQGMPIESQLPYLDGLITRNSPQDIVVLLKREQYTGRSLQHTAHRAALADRTVEAYASGDWEPLADAFSYSSAMASWLRTILVDGLVERGDSSSFGHVFINGVRDDFGDLDPSSRRAIGDRLAREITVAPGLAGCVTAGVLRVLASAEPQVYARVAEAMRQSGNVFAGVRLLALEPDGQAKSEELVRLLSPLDFGVVWRLVNLEEFWGIYDATPDLIDRLVSASGTSSGAARAVELLSLLTRKDQPVVRARQRPKAWPSILGSVRAFLESGGRDLLADLGWDRAGCAACARYVVQRSLGEHPRVLDRVLKTALLNVHATRLSAEIVHRVTAANHPRDVAAGILKRLVMSGLDLWEAPLADPTAPMLRALLERQLARADEDERLWLLGYLALFTVNSWHRLRSLPNYHYTLREVISTPDLGIVVMRALEVELVDGGGSRGAFSLLSDASRHLSAAGRARFADHVEAFLMRAPAAGPRDAPASEWAALGLSLRGVEEEAFATPPRTIDVADLETELARVLEPVPLLPSLTPAWHAEPQPRSMLQAFPAGFRRLEVEDFKRSL